MNNLKRVGFRKEMDVARRAAAVWVIETSLAYEKLTSPGFTRVPPFTSTPHPLLSNTSSDPRATFESAIADEKYLQTLSDRQLEVLERGITIANNIMTSFRPAHRKIANKYEAMRLNNAAMRIGENEKRIEEEKKRIIDEEKKNVEEKKRVNEEAKRYSDKIYSPFPHLMEAANSQSSPNVGADNPDPVPEKAKRAEEQPTERRKRRSKEARRGVLELAIEHKEQHPSMTNDQITDMFGLERGALSKSDAVQLIEQRLLDNAKRNRSVDKDIGDDLRYNNPGISTR